MGKFNAIGLVLLISITCALSEVVNKEMIIDSHLSEDFTVAKVEEIPLEKDEKDPTYPEDPVVQSLRPVKGDDNGDIILSKDNIVPFLKTVLLAVTHKKDPTYTEIVKLSGKSLLKMAEKKIGSDKYMGGLLTIIKKYVENFDIKSIPDEEQEILGELAEEYLKKHKFEILFPETLLLHQPEMEEFVAKRKELGSGEGRQLGWGNFTAIPVFTSLQRMIVNFTSSLTDRIATIPFIKNLNLDRIGSTFDNIGTTVNEYLPSIRQGAGLPDVGISVAAMTTLAAVGALISAPFFLRNFGGSDEEENSNDIYYNNRRVSPGGVPYQQLVNQPQVGEGGLVIRPQWLDQYERENGIQYGNGEPQQLQHQGQGIPPYQEIPQGTMTDEQYEKYVRDYNSYYIKYKEWYKDYYTQQFGESPPPQQQSTAPNAYAEVNTIPGMQPPPPQQQVYEQQGQASEQEPVSFYQGTSKNPEGESENENKSFQVIHVDDAERRSQQNQGYNQQNQIQNQDQQELYDQQQETYQQQEVYQQQQSYQQQQQEAYQQQVLAYQQQQQEAYQQQQQQQAYQQQQASYQQQQQEAYRRQQETQRQQQNVNQQIFSRPDVTPGQNTQQIPNAPVAEPIPQASSLISQAVPLYVSFNHQGNLNDIPLQQTYTSPRPIYTPNEPTMAHGGFHPIAEEQQFVVVSKPKASSKQNINAVAERKEVNEQKTEDISDFGAVKPNSQLEVQDQGSDIQTETFTLPSTKISAVTSGIFKTSPEPTPKAATTPKPKYLKKPYNKSVRVVTSKSVITSAPVVQSEAEPQKPEETTLKKRKITLPELLQQNRGEFSAPEIAVREKDPKNVVEEPQASEKVFNVVAQPRSDQSIVPKPVEVDSPTLNDVPLYAMDPFYGPRLSRTDSIFAQLSLTSEGCREQVVCNMYRNPNAYTPLSDFLSRQLTVTYDQLKRPTMNDPKILRFFNYLQAARAGQDGYDCAEKYPKCHTDTRKLSYQPIVDAYKKVSVLMNAGSS